MLCVGFAAEIMLTKAFPCIIDLHKLHSNLGSLRAAPASIDVGRMSTLRGAYIALRMADNYGPYGEVPLFALQLHLFRLSSFKCY